MTRQTNRRHFLQAAALGAAGSMVGLDRSAHAAEPKLGKAKFKLGLASYTLRKFDLDQTVAMTAQLGLTHIALKSFHLPLDSTPKQIEEAAKKVRDAGLTLYGAGVIYMRDEQEARQAFEYAKAAGMTTIIGVATYELLPLVDQLVKQYDIRLAIHNHGPTDKIYPVPATAYEKIQGLDKRIGICNDIGHTTRAGVDPSVSAEKYFDRLLDVHVKDVTAAEAEGKTVEIGRGVIDIPKFLRTLIRLDYDGVVSFEYEKDPDNPFAGLAESVGYVRGVLASIA